MDKNKIQQSMQRNFEQMQVRTQVWIGSKFWNVECIDKSQLENNLHCYYYELHQLLLDRNISFASLSSNFSDEILQFIKERGSHPGIPFLKMRDFQDFDFASFPSTANIFNIRTDLTRIALMMDITNHIHIADVDSNSKSTAIETVTESDDDDAQQNLQKIEEKLRSIYKDESALESALAELHRNEKQTQTLTQTQNEIRDENDTKAKPQSTTVGKKARPEYEISLTMSDCIPVHLYTTLFVQHLSKYGSSDSAGYQPSLVSDTMPIMTDDWNRTFEWNLMSLNPIGFVDSAQTNDAKHNQKLIAIIDKIYRSSEILESMQSENEFRFVNILYQWRLKRFWRSQPNQKIANWKVIAAKEVFV